MKKLTAGVLILLFLWSSVGMAETFSLSEQTRIYYQPGEEITFGRIEEGFMLTDDRILESREVDGDRWFKIKLEQPRVYIEGWIQGNMVNEVGTNGFIFREIAFTPELGMMKMEGEITNTNKQDFAVANFKITFFDEDNQEFHSQNINIIDLEAGETRKIKGLTYIRSDLENMQRYKIEFKSGI